eukprot:scaffold34822_cov32-Tisochrysis_lutea.AAC.7
MASGTEAVEIPPIRIPKRWNCLTPHNSIHSGSPPGRGLSPIFCCASSSRSGWPFWPFCREESERVARASWCALSRLADWAQTRLARSMSEAPPPPLPSRAGWAASWIDDGRTRGGGGGGRRWLCPLVRIKEVPRLAPLAPSPLSLLSLTPPPSGPPRRASDGRPQAIPAPSR